MNGRALILTGLMTIFAPMVLAHDPNLGKINEYNIKLEKNPDDLQALKDRGSTFRALEYFDSALADLSRALELSPGDPEVTCEVAICHYRLGERELTTHFLDQASILLETAKTEKTLTPEKIAEVEQELLEHRMRNFADLKRYEDALKEGLKLEVYCKGNLSYQCDIAEIRTHLNQIQEALLLFLEACEACPSFERYCVGAANCYLLLDQPQAAMEVIEAWKKNDEKALTPYLHEGVIRNHHLKDTPGAASVFSKGEKRVRDRMGNEEFPDIEDLVFLARILQAQERWEEAWKVTESLIEDYRQHWVVVHMQGINAQGLNKPRQAESFATEAMLYKRLNPLDWLQIYDIQKPKPQMEPPQGDKEVSTQRSKIFLAAGAAILGLAFLTMLMIRRKQG